NNGNYCLAKPGEIYAVYLPHGGGVTVQMEPGEYVAAWWNPATGEKTALPLVNVTASSWSSPVATEGNDWALLLKKKCSSLFCVGNIRTRVDPERFAAVNQEAGITRFA